MRQIACAIGVIALGVMLRLSTAAAQSAGAGGSDPARGDTLRQEEVIRQVVSHNDRHRAARYMEEAARAKVGPAGAWDDPMLMLGVVNLPTSFSFSEDMMTMKMLGLSQRIPYAGQKGLSAKAARADADAAREDRRGTVLDLVAAAKSAYVDLYYRCRTVEELQRQHDLLEEVVQSTRSRLVANLANQEDVAAAQADVWRLESEILSAQQEVDAAWFDLNALRGRDIPAALPALAVPSTPALPDSVGPWLEAARDHFPPLQKMRRQAESFAFSAAAARRMRWPMLDLSANYGFRQQVGMEQPKDMVGFQATLSLPFFSGRQQGRMARSMQAMQMSTTAEADQLWRDTEAALRTFHQRAVRLAASLSLYRERIIFADEDAYQSAFAGYQVNRTAFIALLMYAQTIYRDRVTANMIANELARTLAEVERYTANADEVTATYAPEITGGER